MFDKYIKLIGEKAKGFFREYGILAVIASLLVPTKIAYFYFLIGVRTNFLLVWLTTCVLTYLLFASFKNKWIPACIYLVLTILMFADVTYSSFFNRYLSVNLLGAAGFLVDVIESIKAVLRARFFLLFIDALVILAALIERKIKKRKKDRGPKKDPDVSPIVTQEPELLKEVYLEARRLEAENKTVVSQEALGESEALSELDIDAEEILDEDASNLLGEEDIDEIIEVLDAKVEAENKTNTFLHQIRRWTRGHMRPLASVFILIVLVFNVSGSYMVTSISNQEIYSYHIRDIIGALGQDGDFLDEGVHAFADTYSNEKEGPIFGVAKGRNLIVIQLESFQNFLLNREYNGQEITPNLNRLLEDNTIYFDNYFQQIGGGNTSDAEFATNNSIYGALSSYTYKLYEGNYFRGLPVLLKEQGYETSVFHGYEDRYFWNRANAYENQGFDRFIGGIEGRNKEQFDMTEWIGLGLADEPFYKQTVEYLKKMTSPFYSFVISLSNHHPYVMPDDHEFIKLMPKHKDTMFGNYINSAAYTDYALGQFFQELKDAGLYDNSIIALYGDHFGLYSSDKDTAKLVGEFLGKDYDFDTMMNVPLIITIPEGEMDVKQTVHVAGGPLDFLPTMAYLMGFETLDTLYLGHNLLTIQEGFVVEQTYMVKGSFFLNDIVFEMSRDGVFENGRAWNKRTGEKVPVRGLMEYYKKAREIIQESESILRNDVLREVYIDGKETETVFSKSLFLDYPDEIVTAGYPNEALMGTNSLEALDASYEAGHKNIKIETCWTEERHIILLKSYDLLEQLFDADKEALLAQGEFLRHDDFMKLSMKNGLTQMDQTALIDWMWAHPDATILAKSERSPEFFMMTMERADRDIFENLIVEVNNPADYTSAYRSILNLNNRQMTAKEAMDFVRLHGVRALSMPTEYAKGNYKNLLDLNITHYIEEVGNGTFTR